MIILNIAIVTLCHHDWMLLAVQLVATPACAGFNFLVATAAVWGCCQDVGAKTGVESTESQSKISALTEPLGP
jgi:hypothetical protein